MDYATRNRSCKNERGLNVYLCWEWDDPLVRVFVYIYIYIYRLEKSSDRVFWHSGATKLCVMFGFWHLRSAAHNFVCPTDVILQCLLILSVGPLYSCHNCTWILACFVIFCSNAWCFCGVLWWHESLRPDYSNDDNYKHISWGPICSDLSFQFPFPTNIELVCTSMLRTCLWSDL